MKNNNEKSIIQFFLSKDILITEELLAEISEHKSRLFDIITNDTLSKEVLHQYKLKGTLNGFFNEMKSEGALQNDKINEEENKIKDHGGDKYAVKIITSYEKKPEKRSIQDFVAYFNRRYNILERILRSRKELVNLSQISKILKKKDRETVSVIGMVSETSVTKNGNIFLTLEDQAETIKVLINKNRPDLFKLGKDIVEDEVIGIKGVCGDGVIFANSIVQPNIPLSNQQKTAPDDTHAIFLSDVHVGSKYFLEGEFMKFLRWIKGEIGTETQKKLVDKIKYIFIVGDLVDGVGIFPGQQHELEIEDVIEQYNKCAEYLKMIPSDKKIIICGGNHDPMRLSEPQPILNENYAKSIHELPNVVLVANPSLVNIHASEQFSGFNILLYHGYSFDYYISRVDSIRNNGGYDRADLVMKFLLKRRHLAPTHSSSLYVPDREFDPLIIAPNNAHLPDIFITGHIHKSFVSKYRGITLICGSCWQSTTPFQEKVGHHPEPCRVPLINLQTMESKVIRFS